jgi:hypothetical protein
MKLDFDDKLRNKMRIWSEMTLLAHFDEVLYKKRDCIKTETFIFIS